MSTGKTGFRSLAQIGKEFTPIGTGETGFRSLAPIGKEFTSIGTGKTGFRSSESCISDESLNHSG
jgi:hypothetical protein